MSPDLFDYRSMLRAAMRGIVREALTQAAEHGLPGDHHLYIHFRTTHPGVSIPGFLRDRFPQEMAVVLQHQFWGLMVDEEAFSVTLAFDGARYTVTVPFDAVTVFADPSVDFLLPLGTEVLGGGEDEGEAAAGARDQGEDEEPPEPTGSDSGGGRVVDFQRFRKR